MLKFLEEKKKIFDLKTIFLKYNPERDLSGLVEKSKFMT